MARKTTISIAIALSAVASAVGAHAQEIDFVDVLCGDKTHPSVAVRVAEKTPVGILAQIMEPDVAEACHARPQALLRLTAVGGTLYRLDLDATTAAEAPGSAPDQEKTELSDDLSTGTYKLWTRLGKNSSLVYSVNESMGGVDVGVLGYATKIDRKLVEAKIQRKNHAVGLFPSGFLTGSRDKMRGYHYSSVSNHAGAASDDVVMGRVSAFTPTGQVLIADADGNPVKTIALGDRPGTYDISGVIYGLAADQTLRAADEAIAGRSNATLKDGTGISVFAGQRHQRNVGWSNFVEAIGPVYATQNSVFRAGANSDGLILGASYGVPGARADISVQAKGARVQARIPGASIAYVKQLDSETASASVSRKFAGVTFTPILVATRTKFFGTSATYRYAEVSASKSFSGVAVIAGLRKYSGQKTQLFAGITVPFGKTIYQIQNTGSRTITSASFVDDDLQGRYINADGNSHLRVTNYFGPINAGLEVSKAANSLILDISVLRHDGNISLQRNLRSGKSGYLYITAPEGTRVKINGIHAGVTDSNNELTTSSFCGENVNISVDDSNSSGVVQGSLTQVTSSNCLTGHHVKFDF